MQRTGFQSFAVLCIQFIIFFSAGIAGDSAFAELPENYIENTCFEQNAGGRQILLVYASRYGSTRAVATTIRDVLCANGFQVDLAPAGTINAVSEYDAVVLGSAINKLRILPEATEFLKKHRSDLSGTTVRFFILCSALREDTADVREFALKNFLEPSLAAFPELDIVNSGLFGGVVDYRGMNPVEAFIMSAILKQTEGDFRNLERITEWAEGLAASLKSASP
jgi:menaquinone-dependent protoporphyrinogen oxidase